MSTTHFGHLTERQTEPGLVPFYDIQSGNGVGLFLQPRSPHILTDTNLPLRHNGSVVVRLHVGSTDIMHTAAG